MERKNRVPMQVSPEFREVMKRLKMQLNGQGIDKSIRELTKDMAKSPEIFSEIEKKILNTKEFNINIRFDKRK